MAEGCSSEVGHNLPRRREEMGEVPSGVIGELLRGTYWIGHIHERPDSLVECEQAIRYQCPLPLRMQTSLGDKAGMRRQATSTVVSADIVSLACILASSYNRMAATYPPTVFRARHRKQYCVED